MKWSSRICIVWSRKSGQICSIQQNFNGWLLCSLKSMSTYKLLRGGRVVYKQFKKCHYFVLSCIFLFNIFQLSSISLFILVFMIHHFSLLADTLFPLLIFYHIYLAKLQPWINLSICFGVSMFPWLLAYRGTQLGSWMLLEETTHSGHIGN